MILRPSRAWSFALSVILTCACACARPVQSPATQSAAQQSDAEYDTARDLFGKADPHGALEHATVAIRLNSKNAKALYFVAVIHLSFCSGERGMGAPQCKLQEVETFARAALEADPEFREARDLLDQLQANAFALAGQ